MPNQQDGLVLFLSLADMEGKQGREAAPEDRWALYYAPVSVCFQMKKGEEE